MGEGIAFRRVYRTRPELIYNGSCPCLFSFLNFQKYSLKARVFTYTAVFGWFACIQHFAGIPGGRVDGPDLAPGGVGVQPIDGILNPD